MKFLFAKKMVLKQTGILILFALLIAGCVNSRASITSKLRTICNPVDISYRFRLDEPSCREAADPTVVYFHDEYYLFASKSGGYWVSADLTSWKFIKTTEISTEDYAPTVVAIDDTLYFLASSNTIYKSIDLKAGKWKIAATLPFSVVDPALFLDNDKRLFFYWGCSDKNPVYGIELDYKNNFTPIGYPVSLIFANTKEHGWEVPGDNNTLYGNSPWIEGAWINKFNNKYYLQYAGPGTQFKSYSDGVYTSDSPLGPFELAIHNPFAYKPGGFASGAGHGSTFADRYGNYWHIGTVTISQKHMFERRLAIYPAFFDQDDILYADTRLGDFPSIIPDKKIASPKDLSPEWMLLSFRKKVTVSSLIDSLSAENMTDENIRTYWAAKSGSSSEWASIDLGAEYDVYAIQINFAEHHTQIHGREKNLRYQYLIEYATDNKNWKVLIDQSNNQTDNSHPYFQLNEKVKGRFLRIRNINIPDGNIALSGFRVFGTGFGNKPKPVNELKLIRNPENRRTVHLVWNKPENVTGYNIRYGVAPDKLYQNYQVLQDTTLNINSLNVNQKYYFSIESFNENGITSGSFLKMAE